MPLVRVRDEGSLKENEFMILSYRNILHEEVVNGSMEENYRDIIACLEKTVREQYAALLSKDIIKRLVDNLAVSYPALVEGTVPEKISYGLLLDILKKFMERGNSVCYLPKIIERAESLLRENPALTAEELTGKIAEELETEKNFRVYMARR